MRSANLFGPLKGHCLYKALIGLTQASGLAGGFDCLGKVSDRTGVPKSAYEGEEGTCNNLKMGANQKFYRLLKSASGKGEHT